MSSVNVSPVSRSSTTTRAMPSEAGEEVVLAALVVVEPADHPGPRERDVRLRHRLRQRAVAAKLAEPAALVLEQAERDAETPSITSDHLLAPVSSIAAADVGEVLPVLAGVLPPAHDLGRLEPSRVRVVAVHVRDLELAA